MKKDLDVLEKVVSAASSVKIDIGNGEHVATISSESVHGLWTLAEYVADFLRPTLPTLPAPPPAPEPIDAPLPAVPKEWTPADGARFEPGTTAAEWGLIASRIGNYNARIGICVTANERPDYIDGFRDARDRTLDGARAAREYAYALGIVSYYANLDLSE